jgi:oligo-alginate lyase
MKTIREKTRDWSWARSAAAGLQDETAAFRAGGLSVPEVPGGWWHEYVCPEHHTELVFRAEESDPKQFQCPYGCVLQGEPYQGAWLVYRHQALARFVLQSAALYAVDREELHALSAQSVLLRYAEQYPQYPVHPDAQPWMLKGRAFHQALTEAIWSTTLIRGLLLLRDEGVVFEGEEQGRIDLFLSMLGASMEQYRLILIRDRGNPENNYTAWLNACLACVYAAQGDQEKLKALIDADGGFMHHLSIGVKPDGFEFEGSTYYHLFVLRAYFIFAEMALRFGIDLNHVQAQAGQSLRQMLDITAALSGGRGELPALHDGPYRRVPFAREIAEVFEIGRSVYGNDAYLPVLSENYRYLYGEAGRTGLEALLYGQGEWSAPASESWRRHDTRPGLLLKDSGFAVLRRQGNPLSVLADFGEHGGSHGHYDKLHVSLYHRQGTAASDLGMVPYGSRLRKSWYAETASHNTVSVGGKSQAPHTGICKKWEDGQNGFYLWIRSEEAYEGAILDRHLYLADEFLLDWFHVTLKEEADTDWWFHLDGNLTVHGMLAWEPAPAALGTESGYDLVQPLRILRAKDGTGEEIRWSFTLPGSRESGDSAALQSMGPAVEAASLLLPGSEWMEIRTPGNAEDPSALLSGILHRSRAMRSDFVTIFRIAAGQELKAVWPQPHQENNQELSIRIGEVHRSFRLDGELGLTNEGVR